MFDTNAIPTTGIVRDWTIQDIRAATVDGKPHISGHAATFGQRSVNLGLPDQPWYEQIRAGAFTDTLKVDDIRSLWQHDVNFVLGRNTSRTLRLWEDSAGLAFEVFPPDTALVRDLVLTPIARGDVNQMSFMFDALDVNWILNAGEAPLRELVQVRLYEVSPVTFPAYPSTNVSARAALGAMGINLDPLSQAILRANAGQLAETDRALVEAAIGKLSTLLSPAPRADGASRRKRQLELLAAESV